MDKLLNQLLDKQAELKDGLVEQPAQTLHDYHRRLGEIQGLALAFEMIQSFLSNDEDD